MRRLLIISIAVILALGVSIVPLPINEAFAASTVSDDFSGDSGLWTYWSTATWDSTNGYVVLTSSGDDYAGGQIWLDRNITGPFIAEFSYLAGAGVNPAGADGLVFMFYKDTNYVPLVGGALTFCPDYMVSAPGYGIEFDNYMNNYEFSPPDPSENHIALIKDSVNNHLIWANDPRTEDGVWHNVEVDVTTDTVTVYVDGGMVLEWTGAIDTTFGGIGFGAATGGLTNIHLIDDVSITYYANTQPIADDKSVSTDEDTSKEITLSGSDVETVDLAFSIVTLPSHGTLSTITDIDGTSSTTNTDNANITYTPDADYNGPDSFNYIVTDSGYDSFPPLDSDVATVSITVNPINDPPMAHITEIDDETIPLPVSIKVTPQTLNLERLGKWVKVHISDNSDNSPQQLAVTLDGSASYDIDGDSLTYDWTLTGPDGDIPVADDVVSQVIELTVGSYTVTLVVNDGTVDSAPFSEEFTLTNMTMSDLASCDPADFTLNGVVAVELKGGGNSITLSFDDNAIAATVDVGLDIPMILEGPVSGVDYIDVIRDKGKSEIKDGTTTDESNGKAKGKESAPGHNKEPGEPAVGKGGGGESAPGQNKEPGEPATGKGGGRDSAPGQNKQ